MPKKPKPKTKRPTPQQQLDNLRKLKTKRPGEGPMAAYARQRRGFQMKKSGGTVASKKKK